MLNLIAFVAGGLTAATVNTVSDKIKEQPVPQEQRPLYELMQEPVTGSSTEVPYEGNFNPDAAAPALPSVFPGVLNQPKPAQTKSPSVIRITRSNQLVEPTKDPIWSVQLVVDNKVVQQIDALIGHASRQLVNRDVPGTKAPLPVGVYRIDRSGIERGPFPDPELGSGYWIPISPLFQTGRSALGIHQDPSWGKRNGESGTSGCIGLRNPQATAEVVQWIQKYNINRIIVES
jgi:lipoprotein-anchoring transpeptidase ErfK/SrfK